MFVALDWIIVGIYCVGIISLATYISRKKSGTERSAEDYFLAGRSLPWWAIGASLIAANISAEQIIGMSGQGFVVGMAIAVWELTAAIALIVMAKFFLPLFLEKKIYTMPQFLEQRFDKRVSLVLSFFWLIVYIFINLTSVLWLGSLAINALTGLDLFYGLIILALFSLAYFEGLRIVMNEMPEKFDMVLSKDNPSYKDLPGIWILLGLGVWIGHFFYWGFNQYITQRALGAKNIKEAQKGVMFAAYLKLLMPIVIVLPGICAAILFPVLEKSDQAYPTMMSLLPSGLLGLTFAALIAAIVSSLASMSNSISTIFTMDIYRYIKGNEVSQFNLIKVGRITVGYFSPGIVVIFLVALFWKKASSLSVLIAALISLFGSILISIQFPELPFIHRMTIVFALSAVGCWLTSFLQGYKNQEKAINLNNINFSTSRAFNINTLIVVLVLGIIYTTFA